jgi:hypothetical protein
MCRGLARRLPSPAMAVALAALFVSLAGTSYAAFALAPGSVGTAQLKNGAVTGPKLAGGAVKSVPYARTARGLAEVQVTASGSPLTLGPGMDETYAPTCEAGWAAISGGFYNSDPLADTTQSAPYNSSTEKIHGGKPNAWIVHIVNNDPSGTDDIHVWVMCIKANSVLDF